MDNFEYDYDDENGGPGCLVLLIILAILYFLFRNGGGICKYDGLSAEEWADEADYWQVRYQNLRECVEDYDSFDIQTQLRYGGIFYYCE